LFSRSRSPRARSPHRRRPVAAQGTLPTVTFGNVGLAAFDWDELIAAQLGFFTAAGINVTEVYTGSGAADAQQLTAGSLDIAEISSVQLIEAILGGAPITAFLEHQATAVYSVLGRKGLASVAQLKGKTVIVGGPNDITRVFMDKVLAAAKLGPDDYTYLFAGATDQRFAALVNGGVDAAILSPPISARAAAQGYPVLAEVATYFPAFLFDTYAVKPDWAKAHPALVVAFAKGLLQAVHWLYDPANKARAIQILSEQTHTTVADATQSYDLFITKSHVFAAAGVIKDADVAPVLDALVKTGQIKSPAPLPNRFYDNRYALEANAQLRRR
jgi:NitT/TauT family transport system substrate-binding protein